MANKRFLTAFWVLFLTAGLVGGVIEPLAHTSGLSPVVYVGIALIGVLLMIAQIVMMWLLPKTKNDDQKEI